MSLPEGGIDFVASKIGKSVGLGNVSLREVLAQVPASRITIKHSNIVTDPTTRVLHARGQSLPDWLAKKHGRFGRFPDAVAFPTHKDDVREILDLAAQYQWSVIPYGGGTSVVGHINIPESEKPVLTVSLARMNKMTHLDEVSLIATFGSGVLGPDLESQLQVHGYTLGHFPQSFEYSSLGGWVASRSSGQQSLRYGRIEHLFAGGHLESPKGPIEIPCIPASSAASDFKQHVLGSEGRLGILTEVKVRVSPLPEKEMFGLAFFKDWDSGVNAVRQLVQQRVPLSMLRLSNSVETETQMFLSVSKNKRQWLQTFWRWMGVGNEPCMLMYGISGASSQVKHGCQYLKKAVKKNKGWNTSDWLTGHWQQNRFKTPYLRETLWHNGYIVDTLETCVTWKNLTPMKQRIEETLVSSHKGCTPHTDPAERLHVFTHLSHCYTDGATLYTTFVFRPSDSMEITLKRWQTMKDTTSRMIVENGGTISHQHGVGKDHKPYLLEEKGQLPLDVIAAGFHVVDPDASMNPGVILD